MSSPIRSSSASGPIGRPQPSFIAASMSSRVAYRDSYNALAWFKYPNSNAFAMNPARSPIVTSVLPSRCANASTSATTSGSVTTVRTTSTSFITGAGLKKCSPTTLPGRPVATAISVTDNDDVFVAKIVSAPTMPSSSLKIARFNSNCSGTASITNSASASAFRSVANSMRASRSIRSSSDSLPPATARALDCST